MMRLILLSLILTVMGTASAWMLPNQSAAQRGVDWPRFLGPSGDGKSTEKGVKPWPAAGPELKWTIPVGEGYSAPIVVEGRCLIFDRAGGQVRCRSLDRETGKELWAFQYSSSYQDKYNYDGGPRACPVTDGELVYLYGPEGLLHCITLAEGKLVWKLDTVAQFGVVQNFFGVGSTPILFGNKLLVHIGGSPPGSDKIEFGSLPNNGSCMAAFDKKTGKLLFQTGNDLASYASPQLATLNKKQVCLMVAREGLHGFDPEQGQELFHLPFRARMLESVNVSNAVVDGQELMLTESYAVGSKLLRVKNDWSLEECWNAVPRRRDQGIAAHMNTPIKVGQHVYGCTGRQPNDAELRCIEWETGKVTWREKPQLGDYIAGRGTATYVDGYLLYLAEEGVLFLIKANPEKYELISTWDGRRGMKNGPPLPMLLEPAWAAPVVSSGCIYLRGQGRLVCLSAYVPQP